MSRRTVGEYPTRNRVLGGGVDQRLPVMIFSLLGNGFAIDAVRTASSYGQIECRRIDEFGVATLYEFILPRGEIQPASLNAITRRANNRGAHTVIVSENIPEDLPGMDWPTFQARLGGPIKSWLPFEPSFPEALVTLGHNNPFDGVEGRPDELFEEYVHVALQFLLLGRIVRYGQDRRGEARPDGAGLGGGMPTFLYDAKAYTDGYPVDLDSIRRFCSYVQEFNENYQHYVGQVHSFLVVSGHFAGEPDSLQEKSDQMHAKCGVRLTYVTAKELGTATQLLANYPTLRRSVDWKLIFSRTIFTASRVKKSLDAAVKDRVVHAGS